MQELMRPQRNRIILMGAMLVLLLTGCFRQASDSFETADEPLPGDSMPTTQSDDATDDAATPTINIPVTTSTPITFSDEPTSTPEPTITDDDAGELATATTTATPIVPGLPSGPIETNTPLPTPTPNALTPTLEPLETPVDPFVEANDACIHIVVGGDTVFRIAQNNGTTVAAIQAANPELNPSLIDVGDEIILPDCEPTDSIDPVPGAVGPAPVATSDVAPQPTSGTVPTIEPLVHVVATGETLGRIASQYGVTVLQIVQANNLTDPNRLSVGQRLIIPPPSGS